MHVMNPQNFLFTCHPFTWAWVLLACAWVVLWMPERRSKSVAAWGLVVVGFSLMLVGFACRMMIARRAPVTNMYESILWAALGIVLFAMGFQARHRSHSVFQCALPVAVAALILADSHIFDTSLQPLPPILRSPFWLVTHVISITLSYAAFALSMGCGHWIICQRWRGKSVSLTQTLHRSLQIGVGLLAIGILMGGIWAQSAWGRFWGWDPKETWALITLLCYLVVLHGKIAGWWGSFGLAVGSILAFQTVLMAWYGVNFLLGQGLHSYGFGSGGFRYVLCFGLAEWLFVTATFAFTKDTIQHKI